MQKGNQISKNRLELNPKKAPGFDLITGEICMLFFGMIEQTYLVLVGIVGPPYGFGFEVERTFVGLVVASWAAMVASCFQFEKLLVPLDAFGLDVVVEASVVSFVGACGC